MTDIEKHYVQVSRSLASHLCAFAKDRRSEDRQAIAAVESELCRLWRSEKHYADDAAENSR